MSAAGSGGAWLYLSVSTQFFSHPGDVRGTMEVDEKTVHRIARLARIKVTDQEAQGLRKELSGILDWVKQLDEVDTTSVEPMTRVVAQEMKKRRDAVTDGEITADVVRNAPMSEDGFFVVPKVVE